MFLIVSFLKIPKFDKKTNMFAYYIDKSDNDETDDNFYAVVTDKEPINDIEICCKIPDDIIHKIRDYFFTISSKDGYQYSREDIIIFNTIYSHHIQEFDNDITNFILNDYQESYKKQIDEKKIYYNYFFKFDEMKINHGKLNDFNRFLSEIKTSEYYNQVKFY